MTVLAGRFEVASSAPWDGQKVPKYLTFLPIPHQITMESGRFGRKWYTGRPPARTVDDTARPRRERPDTPSPIQPGSNCVKYHEKWPVST